MPLDDCTLLSLSPFDLTHRRREGDRTADSSRFVFMARSELALALASKTDEIF